jgi:hypothetical protein
MTRNGAESALKLDAASSFHFSHGTASAKIGRFGVSIHQAETKKN